MIKLTEILKEDCWKGYKQYGMKQKNGKQVPNCVPIDEESINEIGEGTTAPFKWRAVDKADQKITLKAKELHPVGDGPSGAQFKVTYVAQGAVLYNISFLTVVKRTINLTNPGDVKTPWSSTDKVLVEANVSFNTMSDKNDDVMPETNLNEQYRLMATVMQCIEDYVKRIEGLKVEVYGGKEYTCVIYKLLIVPKSDSKDGTHLDSRRARLYKAFLEKNLHKLPFKVIIDTTNDWFELKRDTDSYKP